MANEQSKNERGEYQIDKITYAKRADEITYVLVVAEITSVISCRNHIDEITCVLVAECHEL